MTTQQMQVDPETERCEVYLEYAETTYEAEHDRYGWLEEKAMRYLTMLTFIVGSSALTLFEPLVEVLRHPRAGSGFFVALTVATTLLAVAGVVATLVALRMTLVQIRLTTEMTEVFDGPSELNEIRSGLAVRFLEAAGAARAKNDTKAMWLSVSFGLIVATIVTAAFSLILYPIVAARLPEHL